MRIKESAIQHARSWLYEVAIFQAQAKLLAVSNMVVLVYWF